MRIGIDIDGVLTDVSRFQLDYGSEFFNKKVVDPTKFDIKGIYNVSDEEERKFWDKYLFEYATSYKPRYYVKEALKELHNMGVEIIILTARFRSHQEDEEGLRMRTVVKEWLKSNDLYYDKIIFSNENKDKRVDEFGIDLMIEDKPENIYQIAKLIPVIIVHSIYNSNLELPNTFRCYNWFEILELIKNNLTNK